MPKQIFLISTVFISLLFGCSTEEDGESAECTCSVKQTENLYMNGKLNSTQVTEWSEDDCEQVESDKTFNYRWCNFIECGPTPSYDNKETITEYHCTQPLDIPYKNEIVGNWELKMSYLMRAHPHIDNQVSRITIRPGTTLNEAKMYFDEYDFVDSEEGLNIRDSPNSLIYSYLNDNFYKETTLYTQSGDNMILEGTYFLTTSGKVTFSWEKNSNESLYIKKVTSNELHLYSVYPEQYLFFERVQ